MTGLDAIRKEIEDVDRQLLELMKRRLELCRSVGEEKAKTGAAVRNIAQENDVVDRYRGFALRNGMNPVYAEAVCRTLMQESVEAQAALPRPTQSPMHVAIIGGYGKMGRWMADLLSGSGHSVDIIDPSAGNGLTVEDAKWADVVIVSIPISRTGGMLRRLDAICKDDVLIFDIASLKSPFIDVLKELGGHRCVCSVHPMFGPSAQSMYNRNVLICDCGSEIAVERTLELLGNHGANVRTMPVDEHDRYMSYALGLSHAVNIAFFTVLERSGIPYKDMETVASTTYQKLMDTNKSVALEDPNLYYEIQHLNSNRSRMLGEFDGAVHDVVEAALSDDPRSFKELMDRGREYFTERSSPHRSEPREHRAHIVHHRPALKMDIAICACAIGIRHEHPVRTDSRRQCTAKIGTVSDRIGCRDAICKNRTARGLHDLCGASNHIRLDLIPKVVLASPFGYGDRIYGNAGGSVLIRHTDVFESYGLENRSPKNSTVRIESQIQKCT